MNKVVASNSKGLIQRCAEYDEAETTFEKNGSSDNSAALTEAKKALLRYVKMAKDEAALVPKNEAQERYRQDCINVMAYFAAWHVLRGGWRW